MPKPGRSLTGFLHLPARCFSLASHRVSGHALVLAVTVSVLAGILSSGLIYFAYLQRLSGLKKNRYETLLHNLQSAEALLMANELLPYDEAHSVDLYGEYQDSVCILKKQWGIYELGLMWAMRGGDTLRSAALYGKKPKNEYCLYVADNNRPLSLAGETMLKGDKWLSAAGIKKAFIHGVPFTRNEHITGNIKKSGSELPALHPAATAALSRMMQGLMQPGQAVQAVADTGIASFFAPTAEVNAESMLAKYKYIEGNFILLSQKPLVLSSGVHLRNVVVMAPAIVVQQGFRGNVQLMATDSVILQPGALLEYPSGIVLQANGVSKSVIKIGENAEVRGDVVLMNTGNAKNDTGMDLAGRGRVTGSVYVQGYADIRGEIAGSLTCSYTVYKTEAAVYENHLLNAQIDPSKMPAQYAGSSLFSVFPRYVKIKTLQ